MKNIYESYIGTEQTIVVNSVKEAKRSKEKDENGNPVWVLREIQVEIKDQDVNFTAYTTEDLKAGTVYDGMLIGPGAKNFAPEIKRKAPPVVVEPQEGTPPPNTEHADQPAAIVVSKQSTELAEYSGYSARDIEVMVQSGIVPKGTPPGRVAVFLAASKALGLNPFIKEIYLIGYWSEGEMKYSHIIGIDGFNHKAHATGMYRGCDELLFDGLTTLAWFEKNGEPDFSKGIYPKTATCTVNRIFEAGGQERKFTKTVFFKEYYPGDKKGFMWRAKPFTMLGKTATAHTLRFAFDMGQVYLIEEMEATIAGASGAAGPNIVDQIAIQAQITAATSQEELQAIQGSNRDLLTEEWFVEALNNRLEEIKREGVTA